MISQLTVLGLAVLASFGAGAGVKVTGLDLAVSGAHGYVNVALEGRSGELPDVRVFGNTIEVTLSDAEPFGAITRTVSGARLSANVLNGKAIVKAILPYDVNQHSVDLGWKGRNIEVIFPRGVRTAVRAEAPAAAPATRPANPVLSKVEAAVPKDALNEDYLNKLMKEEAQKAAPKALAKTLAPEQRDTVTVRAAAPATATTTAAAPGPRTGTDGFSFAGYAAKFAVFLAFVLGLFYGVVQLLKRGVFNKGKLGFLNNTQLIQVLSTTYVAPKRSLLVVKAHKQIFLVANSETGLQFLAEMSDTSGLVKEGEKLVTGTNFDLNLGAAEADPAAPAVKLKENIAESAPLPEDRGIAALTAKDIVKFSDELKKKAKKLKPIEFN
jgi:flagellar biogenesis protein FliO